MFKKLHWIQGDTFEDIWSEVMYLNINDWCIIDSLNVVMLGVTPVNINSIRHHRKIKSTGPSNVSQRFEKITLNVRQRLWGTDVTFHEGP